MCLQGLDQIDRLQPRQLDLGNLFLVRLAQSLPRRPQLVHLGPELIPLLRVFLRRGVESFAEGFDLGFHRGGFVLRFEFEFLRGLEVRGEFGFERRDFVGLGGVGCWRRFLGGGHVGVGALGELGLELLDPPRLFRQPVLHLASESLARVQQLLQFEFVLVPVSVPAASV